MRDRSVLCAMLAAFLVSGCAAKPVGPDISAVSRYIDQQTAFAVDNKEFAARYGALAAYNPNAVFLEPPQPDNAFFILVDSQFQGTVEDLTKHIAGALGYEVAAAGEKPGAPITVSVNQPSLTALGLLREGFAQARTRATLTIDQRARVMTVRYKRPESSPVAHQDDVIL
ncbi:DotD/TraH family lipoprotein [Aurantimonas sp. C2-6-R+9]|uniref:DotD/TraH family lipoprotein n=1 Tax=unclassified Aurantimonas TaxID=2638230 RepID=UPI002E18B122|nr:MULTISPECIES: DotD/TraH family lipoprotein [unclassified Aurantimonas]MEC5291925.1 DotD/TraH family lipoprotein [Aurantimonas sp. C2-3-R2]MEC5382734.1 DotD/TraH family lipoprotein [Aurantimonas sp. C2-6-R+9]MEC5413011.1 DotD/TraH family lipoprotein [Aurantimonas sp. C2-4-R8]